MIWPVNFIRSNLLCRSVKRLFESLCGDSAEGGVSQTAQASTASVAEWFVRVLDNDTNWLEGTGKVDKCLKQAFKPDDPRPSVYLVDSDLLEARVLGAHYLTFGRTSPQAIVALRIPCSYLNRFEINALRDCAGRTGVSEIDKLHHELEAKDFKCLVLAILEDSQRGILRLRKLHKDAVRYQLEQILNEKDSSDLPKERARKALGRS